MRKILCMAVVLAVGLSLMGCAREAVQASVQPVIIESGEEQEAPLPDEEAMIEGGEVEVQTDDVEVAAAEKFPEEQLEEILTAAGQWQDDFVVMIEEERELDGKTYEVYSVCLEREEDITPQTWYAYDVEQDKFYLLDEPSGKLSEMA